MKKRNIGAMIILSILTLGIYVVYWQCSFQNQLKKRTGLGFSGVGHFFMSLITFGIYPLYWQYAVGKRLEKLGAEDKSILYLIIALVGFSFINMFIMQDAANRLEEKPAIAPNETTETIGE